MKHLSDLSYTLPIGILVLYWLGIYLEYNS